MKISTKGKYGLQAMVDLAVNSSGEPITLKSIAQRQDISENYLEQVFSVLKKSALVISIKGPQGGYILSDKASNIIVGDILRALEGNLSVVDYSTKQFIECTSLSVKDKVEYCISVSVWDKINKSIDKAVDGLSLEDLVNEYNKLDENNCYMYYI